MRIPAAEFTFDGNTYTLDLVNLDIGHRPQQFWIPDTPKGNSQFHLTHLWVAKGEITSYWYQGKHYKAVLTND